MKQALSTLLFLFFAITAFSQVFEGKITYSVSYKSKVPNVTDAQLTSMMGNRQEYFIKGGNYKSVVNGSFLQWQLYPSKDTAIYNKMSASESVYWIDAKLNKDEVLKSEVHKGVAEILGYTCDELILTCKSGIQKYYYSSKLPVDYTLFSNHQYGNWYAFLEKARAIPLKMVVENAQLVTESVATDVKPMKFEKELFQLPKESKLEKMPF